MGRRIDIPCILLEHFLLEAPKGTDSILGVYGWRISTVLPITVLEQKGHGIF